jgi:hypothetical protein
MTVKEPKTHIITEFEFHEYRTHFSPSHKAESTKFCDSFLTMTRITMNTALGMTSLTRQSANTNALNEATTPTQFDVLCGTGIERVNQPGNELFTVCVLKYVQQYTQAQTKKHKMSISKAALDELTELGVRFLKKHPLHQRWYVADQKVGRDRIGHFLRQRVAKNEKKGLRPSPSMRPIVPLSNVLCGERVVSPLLAVDVSSPPQSEIRLSSANNVLEKIKKFEDGANCPTTYAVEGGDPPTAEQFQPRMSSPQGIFGNSTNQPKSSYEDRRAKSPIILGVNTKSSVCFQNCVNTKKEKLESAFVKEAGSFMKPVEMMQNAFSTTTTADGVQQELFFSPPTNQHISIAEGNKSVSAQIFTVPADDPVRVDHLCFSDLPSKVGSDISATGLTYMQCYGSELVSNAYNGVDFDDDVDLFDEADLAERLDWQEIRYC